jgi:hypothetical protein
MVVKLKGAWIILTHLKVLLVMGGFANTIKSKNDSKSWTCWSGGEFVIVWYWGCRGCIFNKALYICKVFCVVFRVGLGVH